MQFMYTAVIEIPKNCDRRIHWGNRPENKGTFVDLGPLYDVIPVNDGKMPMAYGFLKGTVGTDGEGDEVDVLIFSNKEFKTGDEATVTLFGILKREDGDQKVLAHDETVSYDSFQNLDPELQKVTLDFHGSKHKITSIEEKAVAEEYVKATVVQGK